MKQFKGLVFFILLAVSAATVNAASNPTIAPYLPKKLIRLTPENAVPVVNEEVDADAALARHDYRTARNLYRSLAEKGSSLAAETLGLLYGMDELGADRDYAQAFKWYLVAAQQGRPNSQCMLGIMYRDGIGVVQNNAEALKWFRLAAESPSTDASSSIADAQFELGKIYLNGNGVDKNYAEAFKWFRLSAQRGNANGQFSLGLMYKNGWGVAINAEVGLMWLEISLASGLNVTANPAAAILIEYSRANATAAQALKVKMLVRSCMGNKLQGCD